MGVTVQCGGHLDQNIICLHSEPIHWPKSAFANEIRAIKLHNMIIVHHLLSQIMMKLSLLLGCYYTDGHSNIPPFWAIYLIFVSPELSSGRDLVIQMSVRCAPCAVHGFLSGAYLRIRMTYLDDIWYVGGSRSWVAHAEFWVWQIPIKYLICIIYAKICPEHFSGTVCST